MGRTLYSILLTLLLPVLVLRLWIKGRKSPAYRARWSERMGYSQRQRPSGSLVWFHTVSVGETIAAAPLIEAVMADERVSRVLITTTTPTGSDRVKALFGDRVEHVYCPWDTPGCVKRFLRRWEPTIAVMMETELWPNLIAGLELRCVPTILANARLSEKSAQGYAKLPRITKPMLSSFEAILAQHHNDAQRFIALGAATEKVHKVGSVKFDIQITPAQRSAAEALKHQFGDRFVWIAASTHRGEDEQILEAHAALRQAVPNALLVLVPRHPERFDQVAQLCHQLGPTVRRSSAELPQDDTAVYVGDTMGEMMVMFGACSAALVGGSLIEHGGHNVLEPAVWGIPVLSGPHVHNFEAICQEMQTAGALMIVPNSTELSTSLVRLATDAIECKAQGEAAAAFLETKRGALAAQLAHILALL
ncbi:lipid IV(A) 3-deoxy-D-manno-octulosonic acid transferase [Umboniibacter marinipuniceus]|uniref:3-deoxy-D-manno-octulosonic acid transferase n=1 Tax=Umboniibacter marinipuniceus TaxID=569599 RepID=A0A3M0AAY2_9GAMM|nr:lipid IV(A) 3-deoxy-D-manno-octulosonic acid transferase [Umboniibacter marinipuniceus]RMA82323.1 3-deoxy-D-manno-octulosonic-acid transferase [Umboniibacter marinipuniceus]